MTYTYNGSELDLAQLKQVVVDELTNLRQVTLDKFQRSSPGVSRVYAENLLAAQRYLSGVVLTLSNGMTPTEYLKGLGQPLGLHESQFAAYILSENQRLGMAAYSVEQGYLQGKALCTVSNDGEAILAFIGAYKASCLSVVGA